MSDNTDGYGKTIWKQFKRRKAARWSLYVLVLVTTVAVLAPVIANNRPLYMVYRGQSFFPAFDFRKIITVKAGSQVEILNIDAIDWKQMHLQKVVWPLIVYAPGKGDYFNSNYASPLAKQHFMKDGKLIAMPLRFRHWLGTGVRGDDLLSGLIHGARISLAIGFFSMSIATLIGLLVGTLSGFFGDDRLSISRGKFLMILIGIFFGWFYAFRLRAPMLESGLAGANGGLAFQLIISFLIFALVITFFFQLGRLASRIPGLKKTFLLPVDSILSRLIEIVISLPVLLLIITIAAISKPSITNVVLIIGFTVWTGVARLTRAEMLKVRSLEYIQAAEALGFSTMRIMLRHALPNAMAPALISVSFGVANAILIESSLSFIGLGTPSPLTTWGSLVNEGRDNLHAWWLVIFPGACIVITVLAFNLIGEGLRDALDPKLKN